jgi:hypothetical protein
MPMGVRTGLRTPEGQFTQRRAWTKQVAGPVKWHKVIDAVVGHSYYLT